MKDKDPIYVDDEQPTDGHVLPEFAQDPDMEAQQLLGRFTGKPFLSTDGVVVQNGKTYEVQSPKQVDILAGEKDGQIVFETTSDVLAVAKITGFDARDYPSHPLSDADTIDRASVSGRQLASVKKYGASRHIHEDGVRGRIKGLSSKK